MAGSRGSTRRAWVKIYITGWLHGSIRWQLEPEERSVWADLLCLAGECSQGGVIADNDGRGFPRQYIANHLNIPIELLESTIKKCQEEGRIDDREDGVLQISNWVIYQSEYERLKKYRGPKNNKPKKAYGELKNVYLTDDEHAKLKEKLGEESLNKKIEELSLGISSKGYKYRSHYATILNWLRREKSKGSLPTESELEIKAKQLGLP